MKCIHCQKEKRPTQMQSHVSHCKLNPNRKTFFCQHCAKDCKNEGGIGAHEKYCEKNPLRIPFKRAKGQGKQLGHVNAEPAWNKGLVGDPRCAKPALGVAWGLGLGHNEDSRSRLSEVASERILNGWIRNNGRNHRGWYKGMWLESSWELAFVLWCEAHDTPIQRCNEAFPYEFEGVTRHYHPDFIVDEQYVEVKGWENDQWDAKKKAFPHHLEILTRNEMTSILEWCVATHGAAFTALLKDQENVDESLPNGWDGENRVTQYTLKHDE